MRSLAILGAGGQGRVVADCAEALGWEQINFFDDCPVLRPGALWPLAGSTADLLRRPGDFDGVIVAIGANADRLSWQERLRLAGAAFATLIHPRATVSAHARIGAGSVVFAGAVINIGAVVGEACIINTAATVDHDCTLAEGVHISPGAHLGGNVTVGQGSWIGLGASVRQGVVIGANACVGAGAAVVRPVPENETHAGVPARLLVRELNA